MKKLLLASLIALPLFATAGQETPAMLDNITGSNLEFIDTKHASEIRGETITVSKTERRCYWGYCGNVTVKKKVSIPVPAFFGVVWVKH